MKILWDRRIEATPDFQRIKNLPTRTDEDLPKDLVGQMTALLKQPGGTMTLRHIQAQALFEIGTLGGMLGPIEVGGGKTLISLLAPAVLGAKSPLLLLPAKLVEKTGKELRELAPHWRIPKNIQIVSYEMLGRVQGANILLLRRPDLIVGDEIHRAKNRKKAACARRLERYMRDNPETKFVGISGTIIRNSLHDFAHIARWALGREKAPIPREEGELIDWADALDERIPELRRADPGALLSLPGAEGETELERARRAFHTRLTSTPGVVTSKVAEPVGASISVMALPYEVNAATDKNFQRLRELWERPDGWALSMATEVYAVSQQLTLGLHYTWSPLAPTPWLNARKAWAKFVRSTISDTKRYDSELEVRRAALAGDLDRTYWDAWEEIAPSFQINSQPVWHDDSALRVCEKWLQDNVGIVWTGHSFFARELSKRTGIPYYGAQGKDKDGNSILTADPRKPIIASMKAVGEGVNLQAWCRNLITANPENYQQLLGRTHRPGQCADEVTVEVLYGCREHHEGFEKSLSLAEMHRDLLGAEEKLLIADKVWPDRVTGRGWRWAKNG